MFYDISRWLSRGHVVVRVYNLPEDAALVSEDENPVHAVNILLLSVLK
jgi:hypothetical protein